MNLKVILGAAAGIGGFFIPRTSKTQRYIGNGLMIGGGAVAAYGIAETVLKQVKKRKLENLDGDNSPAARNLDLAKAMYGAMYDWGSLFGYSFNIDEPTLYRTAALVTDWDGVKQKYRAKYDRNLPEDLEDKMSSSELQRFYDVLKVDNKHLGQGSSSSISRAQDLAEDYAKNEGWF